MSYDYQWTARLVFVAALGVTGIAAGGWFLHSSAQYVTYRIETHDPVSGLIVDSPVELHGVEVGNVARIQLTDSRTVGILLRVAKKAPVSRATMATITARGLAARGFTGYVYVALEDIGTKSGPLMIESGQRYPVIPTTPSLTDTMDTTVADAVQEVRLLTQQLQSTLDEKTVASLKQSLQGFQVIVATLVANNDRLGSLIVNTERDSRDIGALLDENSIRSLKRSISGLAEIMSTLVANNQQLGSLIVNAERDSRDATPLLETSTATVTQLHMQLLPRLYQSIGDLDSLAHSLNALTEKISRDPSTIIRGTTTPPGPGER